MCIKMEEQMEQGHLQPLLSMGGWWVALMQTSWQYRQRVQQGLEGCQRRWTPLGLN